MMFGTVQGDLMVLNRIGEAVAEEWLRSADIRSEVTLDEFVVKPNHLHAVLFIARHSGGELLTTPRAGSPSHSLSALIQGFKASATRRVNRLRGTAPSPVWQRNYYERVLRNDRELEQAREYIQDNPRKWAEDKNNPEAVRARSGSPPGNARRRPAQ